MSPATFRTDAHDLTRIPPLGKGTHTSLKNGACIMEAVAFIAGEPWSDRPICACTVISAFLRSWNDALPDDDRDTLLRPLIVLLPGTRGTAAIERRRATMAADWLVREYTPAWLRLAGLTAQADALSTLPEITNFANCPSLKGPLEAARIDADAAGAAVAAAAWAAARDAARDTAWDAAWDAAGAAAWAAAADSAGAAAWAAAAAAAWAAAADAAGAAVAAAAWAAGWAALKSTTATLQQSALGLVHRMIAERDA